MKTRKDEHLNVKDIEVLANWLDAKFTGPFGFKFGFDALIGLIPGFGDLFTTFISSYVVLRAAALKLPKIVLIKMATNILIDQLIGSIPILGDLIDFGWKSNQKNYELIVKYSHNRSQVLVRSWTDIIFLALILLSILVIPIIILVLLVGAIFG